MTGSAMRLLVSLFMGVTVATGWAQTDQIAPVSDHEIALAGPPELVISSEQLACGATEKGSKLDVVDIPLTAFRRSDKSVVVLATNQNNYALIGPSVEQARRVNCDHLVEPENNPDPSTFRNRQWLFALYAKSYDLVLGFVHNEYHGSEHVPGTECKVTTPLKSECMYNSTTLVFSTDGGFSFQHPRPPDNVVATLSFRFTPGKLRAEEDTPKVVGNPGDGMVYVMVDYIDLNKHMAAQQCVLRGSGYRLNDWSAWDGNGFSLRMGDPYVWDREDKECAPVLNFIVFSVKYVPAIDSFVAVGIRINSVIYSFSKDLITWSSPRTLMDSSLPQLWKNGTPPPKAYFSLLDPSSGSINFDTLENRPYLYYVQWRIAGDHVDQFERDVYRVPLAIK